MIIINDFKTTVVVEGDEGKDTLLILLKLICR